MPWVRLDDHFDQHQKFAKAGPLGIALWTVGLAYCNRNLTDGFIPWVTARQLVSWQFLGDQDGQGRRKIYNVAISSGMTGDDVTDDFVIEQLLAAELWEEVDGGYMVHDYADYQPTKADVEEERQQKQAAGRAGGQASAQARASAGAQAKSKPVPVPVPNPVPSTQDPEPNPVPGASPRAAARAPARGHPRVQAVIDEFRKRDVEVFLTARDHAAIKHSDAPPELVAECYDAVARGVFGDEFMRKRLSVHEAISWVNAYQARQFAEDDPNRGEECSCAQRLEWLKINHNSNPYCDQHGDVRELVAG